MHVLISCPFLVILIWDHCLFSQFPFVPIFKTNLPGKYTTETTLDTFLQWVISTALLLMSLVQLWPVDTFLPNVLHVPAVKCEHLVQFCRCRCSSIIAVLFKEFYLQVKHRIMWIMVLSEYFLRLNLFNSIKLDAYTKIQITLQRYIETF